MSQGNLKVSNDYIAYLPDLSPLVHQKYFTSKRREKLPAIALYLARYKAYPCVLTCSKQDSSILIHVPTILNYLKDKFGHNQANDIIKKKYHEKSKEFYVQTRLCDLGNGIMILLSNVEVKSDIQNPNNYLPDILDHFYLVIGTVKICYVSERDKMVQSISEEFLKQYIIEPKYLKLNMICAHRGSGYHLKPIKIRKPMIYELALHYGQDFVKIHEKILKECNKKEGKGIVLLHGMPGSGKTHYIRYLIEEITEKKLIYIPPDMAKNISQPNFLPFLLTHPDSILIIEDAENIIRDRNEPTINPSQAVANILNLSDGLLGDAMHMQIIATFNCDLTTVDKALLRKGRLIATHEFGKLDIDNAKKLSSKLGFGTEHISTPMVLAEIYNQDKVDNDEVIV